MDRRIERMNHCQTETERCAAHKNRVVNTTVVIILVLST